jgi:hypothetical protein
MSLASLRLHSAKWARAACLLRLGYGAPGEVFDDFGGDDSRSKSYCAELFAEFCGDNAVRLLHSDTTALLARAQLKLAANEV